MEQLNRIELRGYVGSARTTNIGGKAMTRLSVATSCAYKSNDGSVMIETTWHNVVAWESDTTKECLDIQKGDTVFVCGRIKTSNYTCSDGMTRTSTEVVANEVRRINEQLTTEIR